MERPSEPDEARVPMHGDLQQYLLGLEEKLRRTAATLRQSDTLPDEGVTASSAPSVTQSVVAYIEELEEVADLYDKLINERLRQIRCQAEAVTVIQAGYQRMFLDHTPQLNLVSPVGKQQSAGGGICCDDVRRYLSHFTSWDPLEFGRVPGTDEEVNWDPRTSATPRNSTLSHSVGVSRADASRRENGQWPRGYSSGVHQSLHTLGEPCSLRGTGQHYTKRGLKSVIDDLVMRQLQHDGVPLTAAMEMDLGCDKGMTAACEENASQDSMPINVAVPREIRHGLLRPFLFGEETTDVLQMVADTYPRTVQWIVKVVSMCLSPAQIPRPTMTIAEGLAALLESDVKGVIPQVRRPRRSGSQSSSAIPTAISPPEVDATPARDSLETRELGYVVRLHRSTAFPWSSQLNEEDDGGDNEGRNVGVDEELGMLPSLGNTDVGTDMEDYYAELREYVSAGDEDDENEDVDDDDEGDEDEEGDAENEDDDEGDVGSIYLEESAEEEEEEGVEVDDDTQEEGEDDTEEDHHVYLQHQQDEEGDGDTTEEVERGEPDAASRRDVRTQPGRNQLKLAVYVMRRLKAFLSDLVIITALQQLALMVARGRSTIPDASEDEGGKGVPTSETLQRATEFVLRLCNHPSVAWRLAVENETQPPCSKSYGSGETTNDTTPLSPLLLSFRHVLATLGYMSLALETGKQFSGSEPEVKEHITDEKLAQERLLWCMTPFLYLWDDNKWSYSSAVIPSEVTCGSSRGSYCGKGGLPVVPLCTTPLVWREGVLLGMLNQVGQLRQLEDLLQQGTRGAKMVVPTSAASPHPECLLYRFVYPLSTSMLRNLEDCCGKGLITRCESNPPRSASTSESPQRAPFHLPPAQQSPTPVTVDVSGPSLSIISGFRGVFRGLTGSRSSNNRIVETVSTSNSGAEVGAGDSGACPKSSVPQHNLILELPHTSTMLSQQDGLQRRAASMFLYPKENAHLHLANPAGSNSYLVWQPTFQRAMCYCPITRRRCIDACVHGVTPEQYKTSPSLLATETEFGFNPAQLLNCGHVISHRAMMALVEQQRRRGRGSANEVRCPYCTVVTPVEQSLMLSSIF